MLILGVDTSGKHGSIALVDCQAQSPRTLDVVPLEGGTFSAQLVPQIAALLQKHGLKKNHIDAFAVVSGPGSFTGLRVGLAAIKALAEILGKPIVPVSFLEAVAVSATGDGRIAAVTDAGRGEIYVGIYDVLNGIATRVSEQVGLAADLTSGLVGAHLVTPDHSLAEILRKQGMTVHAIPPMGADSIARLGFEKHQRGETVTPEDLDATYIRRSEAEIKFAERSRFGCETEVRPICTIRAAKPRDIPEIMRVEQSAPSAAHWTRAAYEAAFHPDAPLRIALLAEKSERQVCGFLFARSSAGECELENIVVGTSESRQGIGSALLQELSQVVRAQGAKRIFLEVRESNRPARGLYEKLGFRCDGERNAYYSDPIESAILYSLTL